MKFRLVFWPKFTVMKSFYLLLIGLLLAVLLAACGDNTTPVPPNLEVVTAAPQPADTTAASTVETTTTQAVATSATTTTAAVNTTSASTTSAATTGAATTGVATTAATTTAVSKTTAAAMTAAAVAPTKLKTGVLLEPMTWEHQTWNNCAPMSIIYALSYYGKNISQAECGKALRPNQGTNNAENSGDKHVSGNELVAYIQKQGFKVVMRENGSLDTIRALLSAGVPVITQQWLHDGDDIGHYRTARGYDLATDVFIFNDSEGTGPKTVVASSFQDKLWKGWDRRYFPVYTARQEATVMAILGEDANEDANMRRAIAAAQKYTEANPKDIDGWRNLGYLQYASDNCKAALNTWEQNIAPMLKPTDKGPYNRFLWYQLWPVRCYNQLGNYQQVLKIAPNEIEKAKIFAEVRYEYAVALVAARRKDEAVAQLKKALLDDQNYKPIYTLLDKLQAS